MAEKGSQRSHHRWQAQITCLSYSIGWHIGPQNMTYVAHLNVNTASSWHKEKIEIGMTWIVEAGKNKAMEVREIQ